MDINYLLWLQGIRDSLPAGITTVFNFISDQGVGLLTLALACFLYWCVSKRSGRIVMAGFSYGLVLLRALKLVFCVYRPWVRSSLVHADAHAMEGATGYSFPSGHSQTATSIYGGTGWEMRKRSRAVMAVCFVLTALIMFSRNFLGVHTPQDVLVGGALGVGCYVAAIRIIPWASEDEKRLLTFYGVSAVVIIALTAFLMLKPYPMDYNEAGQLLMDPEDMKVDCLKGVGAFFGFIIGDVLEQRAVKFEDAATTKERVIRFVLGIVVMGLVYVVFKKPLVALMGEGAGGFVRYMLLYVAATCVYPLAFPKIKALAGERPASGAA